MTKLLRIGSPDPKILHFHLVIVSTRKFLYNYFEVDHLTPITEIVLSIKIIPTYSVISIELAFLDTNVPFI